MASSAFVNATSTSIWLLAQETFLGQTANYTSTQLLETLQSTITAAVKRQYLHNDYFAGGIGLMLIGAVTARGKWAVDRCWEFLTRKRGVVTVSVSPEDPAYVWLQQWLSKTLGKESDQLKLQSRYERPQNPEEVAKEDDDVIMGSGGAMYRLLFVPKLQQAQQSVFHGETLTFQLEAQGEVPNQRQPLIITALTRGAIERLIREALLGALAAVEAKKVTSVKRWSIEECYWECIGSRPVRPIDSVVLEGDTIETLVKDARTFLESAKWYSDRGVPHRRGYLLHGPPGCGKSSSILALAGELNLDVNLIGLSSNEMNDDVLCNAFSRSDNGSILVLEDIDAAFAQREGQTANTLSFSGLLNCIDGVSAQEGRILIMTTNHLTQLDPALTRPGRCDLHLYLGLASREQTITMYRRFYPDAPDDDVTAFADAVPEGTISPAKLQGYFLLHRNDRGEALSEISELVGTPRGDAPDGDTALGESLLKDAPTGVDAPGADAAPGKSSMLEDSVEPSTGGNAPEADTALGDSPLKEAPTGENVPGEDSEETALEVSEGECNRVVSGSGRENETVGKSAIGNDVSGTVLDSKEDSRALRFRGPGRGSGRGRAGWPY